ncbi:MAG: GNAT family N-acetyltransferase [Actinomycetota bacterium]|nr:GNAT family N-acetyltransferase [Actinomycetota bacterium]
MLKLERIPLEACDWEGMDALSDRVLFQTREWLEFLRATQRAEPVVAELKDGTESVGYFTGGVVRRYGVRILGSPFPGWTTPYIGFNLFDGVSRRAAVEALMPFAFGELGCMHLELRDRKLARADLDGLGFEAASDPTFVLDLTPDEDTLLHQMTGSCRRNVVSATKRFGVTIEEADDLEFADDYHAQLQDVFAKQSLVPTYGVERVRALIRNLHPTGRLLLLRARSPEGACIATGIFPAFNGTAYFWGGASWRAHQKLRPNEALMWTAMRYWKQRGAREIDLGGGADYKLKYGEIRTEDFLFFRRSRVRALSKARNVAKRAFRLSLRARGRLRSSR